MRTLTLHTADELAQRWKRRAFDADKLADSRPTDTPANRWLAALDRERAQGYRVCAAELDAVTAATMEMEAAHHGDPEPDDELPTGRLSDIDPDFPCLHGNVDSRCCGRCWQNEPPLPEYAEAAAANALLDWSQGRRP